MSPRIAAVVTE